ncbi:growth-regulating factor 2 [Oryza sativa Japonica Group]|uniref:Growth-regulating factor 2 n=1 Tax=Oryza sativa subsp. japonica TaxID=39947 RepID=GRF2_ORYSJ|nr:growth-regulating factor 2 [Oryza sativa Japonica Group]Q6AWY7.1 RecName: Full=Growth-regulating factor 2; Short=OsGRF2; AltName: Full=Transcription activator GRF2 [Oryza sativa Japonica Group]KAB8101659.1 hypothetical protein EE612_032549 [Oryza sativa]KAF2925712.1 hypothetical protein DAI22_06g072900 [Oryza sativa Japonica Group]BAD36191.1 putative growth-regulating factor 1 [Oryza sativa Japonica Group]BAS96688.1 Os06g0204800 [Oryza sativa Japonica Group]DAA05206.1 TPA_exp: growth-regul
MMAGGGSGRCLFTATQWQELEHQALIYKYMAAGAPVPPDLLLHLRHRAAAAAAADVDTVPSLAFPPHHLGWGCYGAAAAQYGRRVEDPEPGRCRRTDGKKWRCSREAYGESKYCEKHMHRGKNRSRKPVEMPPPAAAAVYRPSALSISPPPHDADAPSYGAGAGAPLQLHLDSFHASTSPPPSYHRYAHTSSAPLFPSSAAGYGGGWSLSKEHCLTLGGAAADLSLDKPADHHHDATSATTEKPLRRFFDEWPRSDDGRTPWDGTQLSISIPTAAAASPDLAIAGAASRYHSNGDHLRTSE